jgi:hypothetical protein
MSAVLLAPSVSRLEAAADTVRDPAAGALALSEKMIGTCQPRRSPDPPEAGP